MLSNLYQMDNYSAHALFLQKSKEFLEASRMGKSHHILAELYRELEYLFTSINEGTYQLTEDNFVY